MVMKTKEYYESGMALLRKLNDDTQWNTKPAEEKHLPTTDGFAGARAKLGLSQEEWNKQVGGIPDDTTRITCFFTLKDRIRMHLGLKPKDEILSRVR